MSRRLAFYETDAARYPSASDSRYSAANEEEHLSERHREAIARERVRMDALDYPESEEELDFPDGYETDEAGWNVVDDEMNIDDILDEDDEDEDEEESDEDEESIQFNFNNTTALAPSAPHPSSSTAIYSPTSFLQPGVLFSGKQIFEPTTFSRRPIPSTSTLPARHDPVMSLPTPRHTLYHSTGPVYESLSGPFVDYPSPTSASATATSSSERLVIARTSLAQAEDSQHVSQSTLARLRSQVRLLEVRNRLDMLSATADSTSVDESERNEMLEMRALYLETLVPGTFTQLSSIPRTLGTPTLTPYRRHSSAEDSWDLKVYITTSPTKSSDSAFFEFNGIMSAYGVPSLSSSSPLVTTAFTGEIIDVRRKGLWSAPKKWRARKQDDLEYWGQLGPFKDLDSELLRSNCDDFEWVEKIAENWILMRWKESAFINVERQCLHSHPFRLSVVHESSRVYASWTN